MSLSRAVKWGPLAIAIAFLLLVAGIEYGRILEANDGLFVFSLDDPYIHMAMAHHIRQGHYGINASEYSSPSSSIIWPFLIAPIADLGACATLILLLNMAFAAFTVVLLWLALRPEPSAEGSADTGRVAAGLLTLTLCGLVLATNLVPLAFTGLEHSAQVFFCCLVLTGLFREARTGQAPLWLAAAMILAALVRYECMAIALVAAIYLFWRGHRRYSVVTMLLLLGLVGGFSAFLLSKGLPLLPVSVIVKSASAAQFAGINGVWGDNFMLYQMSRLSTSRGTLLVVGFLMLLQAGFAGGNARPVRQIALVMALAVVLHLLFGHDGWYNRYEIYMYSSTLLTLGWIYKDRVYRALAEARLRAWPYAFMFVAGVLTLAAPYVYALYTTPLASNNIYCQQYQMHRFVHDYYRKPVAINDLGWVAYGNDQYVLDLYGLASLDAYERRFGLSDPSWMKGMVDQYQVKMIMIYDHWFTGTPPSFIRIGQLHLQRELITPAFDTVSFYVTDCATAVAVWPQLRDFALSLPAGAQFVFDGLGGRCTPDGHSI